MAFIEKFLGQRVEIPEDLRYDFKQGLWARCVDQAIVFGLSQPALVLLGGVKDLDALVEQNQKVNQGDSILFAITGKILYLEAPVSGEVQLNKLAMNNPSVIAADAYGKGWLFLMLPDGDLEQVYRSLPSAQMYLQKLRHSEGLKNPEGVKGGVSGICKAVYTGIGQQKL